MVSFALPHASRAWLAYLVAMGAASVLYLFGPEALNAGPVYNVLGASAAAVLVAGVRRHRPRARRAWHLLAAAQALFVAGDVLAYNHTRFFGVALPFPSVADVAYLAVYPTLVAGLVLLVRERNSGADRAGLVDSIIITLGLATVSWAYLMAPYVHDATLSLPAKLISIAYPIGDLLVLCVAVRLAVGTGRRGVAFAFLVAGIAALLAADAVYAWLLLHDGYRTGGLLDGGWLAFYALLGAAGLHPSMRRLSEPAPAGRPGLTRRRLVVLAVATLLAPVAVGVGLGFGGSVDVGVVTCAAALLFVLVVVRMAGIVRHHEAAVAREAALRSAGEELVAAAGREAIAAAAVRGASRLAPELAGARVMLRDAATSAMRLVAATDDGPFPLRLEYFFERLRTALHAGHTVTLAEPLAGLPAATCVAPLLIRGELEGLLLILGRQDGRAVPAESLGALATQVALALEAAALTEDLVRRQAAAHLASLVQHSSDVVCVVGLDGVVRYASPSTARVLGEAAERIAGVPLARVVHREDAAHLPAFLRRAASRPATTPSATELRMRHADGSWRTMEVLATNLLDDAHVQGIVLNARDVSERKAFEAQLAHQAFHDALTGLPNRALFRDRVTQALGRQRRTGTQVAVLFFDVDDFKTVNDSLGHAAGDGLLCEVARRLSGAIRSTDTAARLGGDEFAVLLDDVSDPREVTRVAHRMLGVLDERVAIEGHDISPRASVGVAFGGGAGATEAEDLLRNADAAMYVAKAQGKGRYQVFQPEMHAMALTRLELQADLERAIAAGEFTLRYQPIVELATGRPTGVEALVRWEHPVRGLIPPADFIPLAEETGLIVPLGRQILNDACRQAARFHAGGHPDLTVCVNVSARQLQRAELVAEVRQALQHSGIPPSALVLELTESVMVDDADLAVLRLRALHELGVKVAIDDFGTGYSSLNYLRQFPIDILKIDRSFVRGAHEDAEVLALTRAILELAGALGLRPVAEGVEVEEERELLRELGCAYGQGYLFARPLPAEDLLGLLREQVAVAA